jgi:hypothetical protein
MVLVPAITAFQEWLLIAYHLGSYLLVKPCLRRFAKHSLLKAEEMSTKCQVNWEFPEAFKPWANMNARLVLS